MTTTKTSSFSIALIIQFANVSQIKFLISSLSVLEMKNWFSMYIRWFAPDISWI